MNIKLSFLVMLLLSPTVLFANSTSQSDVTVISSYNMATYQKAITSLLASLPSKDQKDKRLTQASAAFIGKSYLLGALGEGPDGQFDQNPLYRTDSFDCETFVDTVIALLHAKNTNDFSYQMNNIRYSNSRPSYLSRNHFTNVDWNRNNESHGYLSDITKDIYPVVAISQTLIDKPNWYLHLGFDSIKLLQEPANPSELLEALHDLANKTNSTVSTLRYIPLTALFDENGKPNMDIFNRIPSGVVIQIVRANWTPDGDIGTALDISHMGIVLRINDQLIFREASSVKQQVIDIPLTDYLAQYINSDTVKGIHVEQIK
ncbi:MAG: N-acetylmuramoyl-L-alanine amidase-like domain-containing protein [Gammaproteobacteria bacterium]